MKFTKDELKALTRLCDSISKTTKDELGERRPSPGGYEIKRQLAQLEEFRYKYKNEPAKMGHRVRWENILDSLKKSILQTADKMERDVREFDSYWAGQRKDILALVARAREHVARDI